MKKRGAEAENEEKDNEVIGLASNYWLHLVNIIDGSTVLGRVLYIAWVHVAYVHMYWYLLYVYVLFGCVLYGCVLYVY